MSFVQTPKPKRVVDYANKTTVIRNVQPIKGIIGEKRLSDLEKAIRNRERRLRRQVKELTGSYSIENYQKMVRGEYLPSRIDIDFSAITSVREYNALMKMLNIDKTKAFKEKRTADMREALETTVRRAISIDASIDPELFARINEMSDKEIARIRMENPEFFKDIYDAYEASIIDLEMRDYLWDGIREAVGLVPLVDKPLRFAL